MSKKTTDRFEAEFAPQIVQRMASLFEPRVHVAMVPAVGAQPTRVRLTGARVAAIARYPYALNIELTWDLEEIEYLFEPGGAEKFERYLAVLPRKLQAWQAAREIDFPSRSQALPGMLIGGLDFIG